MLRRIAQHLSRLGPVSGRDVRVLVAGLAIAALAAAVAVPTAASRAGGAAPTSPAIVAAAGSGSAAPASQSPSPSPSPSPSQEATPEAAPAATPAAGLDAIGRPLANLESFTPSPTPTPSPSCKAVCSTVPAPAPESTPNPVAAVSFQLHVPILEYHRVKPWQGETGYAKALITPPEIFSAQMDAMAEAGWKTITMGELGEDLRFGITPDPKTFVVTFDDGYEDGYRYAFPILLGHGYTATYFVIAQRIGWPSFLSGFEIRQLVSAGNEIGNHSYSHTDLGVMTPEQLLHEINGASATIANYTGAWPRSFAYPMGLGSGVLMDYLAACPGLDTAVIQGGRKPESWSIRWQLPRIRVGGDTYPSDLVEKASRY